MKSLDISIYLQTERGMCPDCLSTLLDGLVIYLSLYFFTVNGCVHVCYFVFSFVKVIFFHIFLCLTLLVSVKLVSVDICILLNIKVTHIHPLSHPHTHTHC